MFTPERPLPKSTYIHWTPQRKAAVVLALRSGILGRSSACRRYLLSEEELQEWEENFDRGGIGELALKMKIARLDHYSVESSKPVSKKEGRGRPTKRAMRRRDGVAQVQPQKSPSV